MLGYKNYRLVFNGLDTYADVELNGEKILSADNMFRRWPVDVSQKLKERGNVLQIYFHSPIKIDIPKWEALPYHYEAGNDQSQMVVCLANRLASLPARQAIIMVGIGDLVW